MSNSNSNVLKSNDVKVIYGTTAHYLPFDDRVDTFHAQDLGFIKGIQERYAAFGYFENQTPHEVRTMLNKGIERTALIMVDPSNTFDEKNLMVKRLKKINGPGRSKKIHPFEPFYRNWSIQNMGLSSGILIDDQTVLAAGHPFRVKRRWLSNSEIIAKTKISFDFYLNSESENEEGGDEILKGRVLQRVYSVQSVEHIPGNNKNKDWIKLKLSSKVQHVEPDSKLDFRSVNNYLKREPLYSVGHPLGLPKKLVVGGSLVENESKYSFRATLDAYQGNSGSPVFTADTRNLLSGLLTSGEPDFWKVKNSPYWISRVLNAKDFRSGRGRGEHCIKTSSINLF